MTIHILGAGAIGCHVASVLRKHNHKVTLLLRSSLKVEEFNKHHNRITYRSRGNIEHISGVEAVKAKESTEIITSLIVTTKSQHTLEAVSSVASQLSPSSTILFLQNGMGVVDELLDSVWRATKPPSIIVGINRHAIERLAPYDIQHHSGYDAPESLVLTQHPVSGKPLDQGLAQTIVGIPEFRATLLPWEQAYVKMIKKLLINSAINPVATILGCKNGGVLHPHAQTIMRSICEEAFELFKDDLPDETLDSIMKMISEMAYEAKENTCSTLQDVKNKRLTEIDYFNGYICKLGKQKGISTKMNEAVVNFIHAKEDLF
ncbi:Putative 2-dehydropantoate 2-reductase [Rhizopus microsporus]|nr:Putative 2-dehydropantoate 2-reductase [Rhizopus microsporus]CEG82474.1 Putative 2-dehydropantoate 2-reductase [Rhizopus microsporus]